jgi:hypothetical protein
LGECIFLFRELSMRCSLFGWVGFLLLFTACNQSAPKAAAPADNTSAAPSGQIPGPPDTAQIPGPPGVPSAPPAVAPAPKGSVVSDVMLGERLRQSQAQLKQIGAAIHSYADKNQKFPPAFVADADGKPLYSWRVLLLPHLNQQALFDRFDKTKAWDAPGNLEISNTALDIYKSPADVGAAANGVSYVALVGAGNVFDGTESIRFADIQDGTSNTALLVEVRGVAGSWAAPVDPPANAMKWKMGDAAGELHSPYTKGLVILMADGSIRFIRPESVPKAFPAFLGINDGMFVDVD